MSDVQLYPRSVKDPNNLPNPLPQLLQTPSGLALLELQGTINLPTQEREDTHSANTHGEDIPRETTIGRLVFPDYDPQHASNTAWMKCVYMYVGKHQRLTGEVKKLPKAFAIIQKRKTTLDIMEVDGDDGADEERIHELEVVEIVKYKILFSTRPEPVGALVTGVTH